MGRIGSMVVVFPRDPCDVWAAGTVRFPREKRATTWIKSPRRASMMRRDTGATRKNIRPLFFAVTRQDNGIPFHAFCLLDLSRSGETILNYTSLSSVFHLIEKLHWMQVMILHVCEELISENQSYSLHDRSVHPQSCLKRFKFLVTY